MLAQHPTAPLATPPALQEPLAYLPGTRLVLCATTLAAGKVKVTPAVPAVFPSGPTTVHVAQ